MSTTEHTESRPNVAPAAAYQIPNTEHMADKASTDFSVRARGRNHTETVCKHIFFKIDITRLETAVSDPGRPAER